jgi:PPOX class probable F420-dependent enzyme
MFDTSTEFGQRVSRRLDEERIIWLTTISKRGVPSPRPVWFLWDGDRFLIYSRPNTYKLEHIRDHELVAINFDGDSLGGNIIIFSGKAYIDDEAPKADQVPAYIEKYREGLKRINMSPEQFAKSYSVAVRIEPTGVRGH